MHNNVVGWRLPRAAMADAMEQDARLMRRMRAWVDYLHNATELAVACRSLHRKDQRFCGKLLLARDALGSDRIPLSLPGVAGLLPADASYVSRRANAMATAGVIAVDPGRHIDILDVDALAELACCCFSEVAAMRDRVLHQLPQV